MCVLSYRGPRRLKKSSSGWPPRGRLLLPAEECRAVAVLVMRARFPRLLHVRPGPRTRFAAPPARSRPTRDGDRFQFAWLLLSRDFDTYGFPDAEILFTRCHQSKRRYPDDAAQRDIWPSPGALMCCCRRHDGHGGGKYHQALACSRPCA